MYFKRLELIGFKSFAEKTELNFEPGVTAVVGPNGCGKSNLADGIRWALGEQSTKSMRSSSMQDVIFNGTDAKEPVNFAEVSLILSNEQRILPIDYDEVTITRRIFRSGDNEYLLNKTPVRLRDISELLMGTGIGTESYSIIEQGKMDLILSSRPEDRRYVFEEASGITKYKAKKKEAMRRLEDTENNLLRINDIIQEVKRQISSIERQARKAEKYKVELEKLKDLELKVSVYEYRNLRSDEKRGCVNRDDLKAREQELVGSIGQMSAKISELRSLLEERNRKISDLKNSHVELLSALDKNNHRIKIDRERIEEAKESCGRLSAEIASLKEKIGAQEDLVRTLKSELSRASKEKESKVVLNKEKEERLSRLVSEIEESEKRVKSSKFEMMELLAKETQAKNELIKLGTEVSNRSSRLRRLAVERETVSKEVSDEELKYNETRKELEEAEAKAAGIRAALEASKREYEASDVAIRLLEEELSRTRNEEAALKSKAEFLEDIIKRHEGFSAGVKAILSGLSGNRNGLTGILGVLADAIEVERGYEEAVNAVLGDDAQTIAVSSLKDALSAISFLKENRLGRANFVPLEALGSGPSRSGKENLTPLLNYVKVDPKYKELADYLFQDTYLVDSIELIKRAEYSGSRFVTKTGIVLHGSRLSGGSIGEKEESLLIGRREKLKEIRRESERALARISELDGEKSRKAGSIEALDLKIKEAQAALHQEEIALANISSRKSSQEETIKNFRDELSVVGLELDEIEEVIANIRSKEGALKAELEKFGAENARLQDLASALETRILEAKKDKDETGLVMATLKTEISSYEKESSTLENNLKKEEGQLNDLSADLLQKEALLKESEKRQEELSGGILSAEAENIALEKDAALFKEQKCALEKEISDFTDKLNIEELQVADREKALEDLRNELKGVEMKIMDLGYKKSSLRERISGAYKSDLEGLHMDIEENTDWETMRLNISEFKSRLDEMGPVNLVAIDEHKELEERHAFLTHQQSDLINAKESLHKAILKINKTTKELFIDVFQKIQVEFKNFFRMLFGGGQAELILIDEEDVLESGIEIVARPPGKKLQNIMLMSGGEKALTAIALLFAVFKVKPSPFCVLDEIDAPLDESNIGRFSNVLKDFLRMSQFIIITHNKKTIELADVMYGITMQERGVSKIVSVKFLATAKDKEGKDKDKEAVGSAA